MSKTSAPRKAPHLPSQHHWHLATDDAGIAVTDFEYAIMRTHEAFVRWQAECFTAVSGEVLTGQENALLHVIRMHGRPKTIKELMQMTNRQDLANVQYGLRKLVKAGMVSKSGSGRIGVYYASTERGNAICDAYAALRREVLLSEIGEAIQPESDLREATRQLQLLEKIYESAAREATTFYRRR